MISIIVVAALLGLTAATPPIWFQNGKCGESKYEDAGDYVLPKSMMIVGGIEARPNEFPWQASLRRKSSNGHFCGGTIINENWILSAAHCLSGTNPATVSVVLGDHTRSAVIAPARQTFDVSKIFVHENYNSRTMANDVALMKLSGKISLNQDVWPACAADPVNNYANYKAQVSGWGTTVSGGPCCPDTLRYTTLNVTTNSYCNAAYPRDDITQDMICASDNRGSTSRDSCQGDSGGPMTIKESDGTFRVVGVVSWGIGCASGYPGVYARVGYQSSWITNIITKN